MRRTDLLKKKKKRITCQFSVDATYNSNGEEKRGENVGNRVLLEKFLSQNFPVRARNPQRTKYFP